MENYPLLSIVVLNWNAKKYIKNCVFSVLSSSYPAKEVVVIDNASTDGSIETLKESFGGVLPNNVYIEINPENYGAAPALNQGVKKAKGKYVCFLASDTKVEPNCFDEIIKIMEADETIGAAEAKLLLMEKPGVLDHAGEYLNQFGFLYHRIAGNEEDKGQFDHVTEIFGAKGTAITARKDVFEKVGGYDEDYFMFLEETDLCWRIWLLGYRIVFVPKARIHHASGASINTHAQRDYIVKYYGCRNYITTLFKNLGSARLLVVLPVHIMAWFLLSSIFLIRLRGKESFYIIKGISWNIGHSLQNLKKRRAVQKMRVVSDQYLMPKIMRKSNIGSLFKRIFEW